MKKKIKDFIPNIGKKLARYSAKEMILRIGQNAINDVVASVLCGGNIRNLTEGLTKKRIALSNAAMFYTYFKALSEIDNFAENFYKLAHEDLQTKRIPQDEKLYLEWMLGLTGKSLQNVHRGEYDSDKYIKELDLLIEEASTDIIQELGAINVRFTTKSTLKPIEMSWQSLLHIFLAIGTQTLALRGSEKSMYGKLFEKLILGSALTILGFEFIDKGDTEKMNKVFWLSEREDKRESDATLLLKPGVGVRFDIGFIGSGNSEISLDKVSRFERAMERGNAKHAMTTIILIDSIGPNSRISTMAKEIDGHIIQMSMSYWVRELAIILKKTIGFEHKLIKMTNEQSTEYIQDQMNSLDIKRFA
jgi:hypothetical protein